MPAKEGVYICKVCQHDCRTPQALKWHMEKHEKALAEKPLAKPSTEAAIIAKPTESTVTTTSSATETVITVKPTVEIADPFLSNRVAPPHIGTGVGESIAKPSAIAEASVKPLAENATEPLAEKPATGPIAKDASAVGPQKETATATAETATAQATQTVTGKPIVQPIHIHIPKEALPSAEGRRDQPQLEAKPSIMMPLGSVTREIEVTTKGMEIQVGSTLLMYYDWLRGRGYERSLSEFINQTVEAYFTEKGLMLGITFRRD